MLRTRTAKQMYKNPNLGVPGLVFEGHEKYTSHLACQGPTTGLQFYVKIRQASTDTPLEIQDRRMRRPIIVLLRDFRMRLLSCIRKEIKTRIYGSLHGTLWGHPHSGLCHVQRYTASCENVTGGNPNTRRTLKHSGSVFGSPKRLDKWMSRNAGI